MDFLRRLAPLRDTDATRAVAVLPSRFASEVPLRRASSPQGSPQPLDEGAFAQVREAAPHAAPVTSGADQRLHVGGAESAHAQPLAPDGEQPKLPNRRLAEARATVTATARASGDGRPVGPQRTPAADAPRLSALAAIAPEFHANPASPSPARVSSPLSQSVVAQRAIASRDDSPVVHVTIGRIDVVAGTPPSAPAARRGPKAPRPATVTLADYLRAGSRR